MGEGGREAILFLERDRLYFNDGAEIQILGFPPSVVKDLDVLDRDALFNLVVIFIQNNKFVPAQIFFVISEAVCFTKDFPITDPKSATQAEKGAEAFLASVPFDASVGKTYKYPNALRATATNQDLIDIIFEAFQSKGFGLKALVPINIYPEYVAKRDLTLDLAKHIIDNREKAMSASMVGSMTSESHELLAPAGNPLFRNKRLMIMIGVFGVLVIILILAIIFLR